MPEKTFCELMKEQLADEDKAGELYDIARRLLGDEEKKINEEVALPDVRRLKTIPVSSDYAVLEKIASDERSHKVLLQVLYGRLCP